MDARAINPQRYAGLAIRGGKIHSLVVIQGLVGPVSHADCILTHVEDVM